MFSLWGRQTPVHVQLVGPPDAGADEDGFVAVPLQVIQGQGGADDGVGADLDAQLHQLGFVPVQDGLGQAEVGDSIPQHTADLVPALKEGDVVALLGHQHRDGDACRAGADDGYPLVFAAFTLNLDPVQIAVRDVVFDAGDVDRLPLDAPDTVALALLLMVADQGADHAEGIVVKEHLARFIQLAVQEHLDHIGDGGMDGAALAAHGLFAVQAATGLVYNMDCQEKRSFPMESNGMFR